MNCRFQFWASTGKSMSANSSHDKKASNPGIAIGLSLGVAFGAAFGSAFDNLSIGIGLGICIGLALGAAMDSRRSPPDPSEVERGNTSPTDS